MELLPRDLFLEFLACVPLGDTAPLGCVSARWRAAVDDGWLLARWRALRGWAGDASPATLAEFRGNARSASAARRLFLAAARRDVGELAALSRNGASQRFVDASSGWSALHAAATRGDVDVARFLLEHRDDGPRDRSLVDGPDVGACTPLHQAAHNGHAAIVDLLLDAGAAVDAGGSNPTWTPLLAALRFGRLDVAKLLLASGADATVGDGERPGRNALFVVTSGSALDAAERLEAATLLVAGGADAAACERSTEWTALHDAAVNDDRGVARLLLEHGANVNATSSKTLMWDAGGRVTPYDVAVGSGFDDLATMLAGFGGARFGDLHCYAGPQGRI